MTFAVERGPRDFFASGGMLAVLAGVGSLILGWRVTSMRSWILGSVMIMHVGEILFSVAYVCPRTTIMCGARLILAGAT